MVEKLPKELRDIQIETQCLRDENNRLKKKQGKPKIKGNTPKRPNSGYSSEEDRNMLLVL